MTLVVVPPLADPTVHFVVGRDERLLDLNLCFTRRAGDPDVLRGLASQLDRVAADGEAPDPVATGTLPAGQRCLLALAAAEVLARPSGPGGSPSRLGPIAQTARLRALGAAIRALSAADAGLTATLDDITLRAGSTQSSHETLLAAARSTLFDAELEHPELARRAEETGLGDAPVVEIVVDADQQLPATFQLVSRFRDPAAVTLSGRFVARHAEALARVPALHGVRLSGRVRRRTVRPEYVPRGGPPPVWVTDRQDLPGTGPWAGWLDAEVAHDLPEAAWQECLALVVSAGAPAELAGAGSRGAGVAPGAAVPEAAGWLCRLAERVPVALEVIVDLAGDGVAPGPEGGWWRGLRLAGFRAHRAPAGRVAGADGHDLARWAEAGPADRGDRASGEEGAGGHPGLPPAWAVERHELFPGRLAGALLAVTAMPGESTTIASAYQVDACVRSVRLRHVSPDGGDPGDFLVNLRTGRVSRVRPSLARLARLLSRDGLTAASVAALGDGPDEGLLDGLCRVGVLRREPAA
jgi:hypothetical protein